MFNILSVQALFLLDLQLLQKSFEGMPSLLAIVRENCNNAVDCLGVKEICQTVHFLFIISSRKPNNIVGILLLPTNLNRCNQSNRHNNYHRLDIVKIKMKPVVVTSFKKGV